MEANDEITNLLAEIKAKNEEIINLDRAHAKIKSEWEEDKLQNEKTLDRFDSS